METNKKKWIIIAVVCVILAVIVYFVGTNACSSESSKIEEVSESYFTFQAIGNRFSPVVQVKVKNITDKEICVQLKCTVYAKDGSVTTGLTSVPTTLIAGETATLTAMADYSYSVLSYNDLCASFGKVEYKFY